MIKINKLRLGRYDYVRFYYNFLECVYSLGSRTKLDNGYTLHLNNIKLFGF